MSALPDWIAAIGGLSGFVALGEASPSGACGVSRRLRCSARPARCAGDEPPPAFIGYAANDPVVPVENGLRLHRAYLDRGSSAELHVFPEAPHGFALRTPKLPVGAWPRLCARWLEGVRV